MTFVRRIVEDDLPDVLRLARQFHAESPNHSRLVFSEERVGELVLAALENPDWLAIVAASDDGTIIGMGLFYVMPAFYSTDLEAGDLTLWVDPGHRGGRAAKQLLDEYRGWSFEKGAKRVNLGVNTGINHDMAVRFFERFGFAKEGTILVR